MESVWTYLVEFAADSSSGANNYMRAIAFYFLTANIFYIVIEVLGFLNSKRRYGERFYDLSKKLVNLQSLPPISVIVPCYNEEKSICASVSSILNLNYPDFEVIVCNDGSKDSSVDVLIREFDLFELTSLPPKIIPTEKIHRIFASRSFDNLYLVDKDNGGKADALNAGINFSNFPLICCVDSDSILDGDGLTRVAVPFFEDPDLTIATGGTIAIANASLGTAEKQQYKDIASIPGTYLGTVQAMEYLRAFLVGRMGWDYLGLTTIISGAFGLFKKSAVIEVGGYSRGTIGEDMELIMRLHELYLQQRRPYRVMFLPDPVCWTEAPSDWGSLSRQRKRWMQGLLESLWRTRRMMYSTWSGGVGMVAMVYLLLFEVFSAPIELVGYILTAVGLYMGVVAPEIAILFICTTLVFGVILNIGAIIVDQSTFGKYSSSKDVMKLMLGAVFEQVGFRQVHTVWRCIGIVRWLQGKKSWGAMKRAGIG